MSKKNKFKNEEVVEVIETEVVVEETPIDEVVQEPVVEPEPTIEPTYVITGCKKLNLRKKPSATAAVVYVIGENDDIAIISDDGDWVEVLVGDKHGYCMKKFIVIK